ncbi:hypothetical protein NEOLEDRAFT_1072714 [Neolentinus lepideus HHB14362 ss-1]|uniref:Aminoglycoside phosphotransferase domain-containing protein n=1 Tax=Neolentinus lepideus HHB14362 ss-1 TaxID=1314782 RepID=A0A165Q503_9AGAM|nr:hypothetical protein NEOLEDRAFT_1072714 [Neolentinus lepideus HHB14362 ss-1]
MHLKKFLLHLIPHVLRRRLYRYLITDGRESYNAFNQFNTVHRDLFGFVIKGNATPSEYAATESIRRNTNIPVPFVYDYIKTGSHTAYFVMQNMSGMSLDDYRINVAPANQLRVITDELRDVRSPYGQSICRFDDSPLDDHRIQLLGGSFGPFPSPEDFHRALLEYSDLQTPNEVKGAVLDRINAAFSNDYGVRLTHGDLTPSNILVDKDLNITSILDWATASWMPEYWELVKSIFLLQYRKSFWRKVMEQVFPQYGDIQEADQLIVKYRRVYT